MKFQYTQEQEKIIQDGGRSLLVSAAAGSGKTAVLVQRIIQKITNPNTPISVDQLLIVTFTHAAASEMRERISLAIEKAIEETADEKMMQHLVKQLTMMASANIMTLHSFCLQILKNYYYLLELDPNFRIGNETELALIQEEILDEIFEAAYEEKSPAFIRIVEAFSYGNDDVKIRDIILTIYRFSKSHPNPEAWLNEAVETLKIHDAQELYSTEFFNVLQKHVADNLAVAKSMLPDLHELMALEAGPDKYKDTVADIEYLLNCYVSALENKDVQALKSAYQSQSIAPLSRKSKGYDKALAEEAKDIINQIKDSLSVVELLCFDEEESIEQVGVIAGDIQELVRLTQLFDMRFSEEKYDKALIDFSDIEHFALALLYDENQVSEIGKRYKDMFHEVLVDEYQDINEVQEAVIQAVSKQEEEKNLFMVGDVKQSIYKFRLARPEIFSQKYRRFSYDDEQQTNEVKIDLAKNFRSRQEVLSFSNHIFKGIMSEAVGDVKYDEKTQLNYGAIQYKQASAKDYRPEILIIEDPKEGESKATIQAQLVANKIHAMVNEKSLAIVDKTGELREVKYQDICILMRSPSKAMEDIKDVLDAKGIPYATDVSTGYFEAIEVQVVLNLLMVLDNPIQDIALVSVLRAPFMGFDEHDLIQLKKIDHTLSIYEALIAYEQVHQESIEEEQSALTKKVHYFLTLYNRLKAEAKYLELHELIQKIYLETGYKNIVRFMDNGSQRMQNLEYLLQQSEAFEASSYKGVFNFVRYIEHMKKYKVDSPEPTYTLDSDNSVTMMSIHKSKGLEFPIVFILDLQKQFNEMDLRETVLMDQDLGLASDYIDIDARTKKRTVFTEALRIKAKNELISEEIRILYVALTRAKEKLYLLATTSDYEKNIEKMMERYSKYADVYVPSGLVQSTRSYLELILMRCNSQSSALYSIRKVHYDEIVEQEAFYELSQEEQKSELKDMLLQSYQREEEWEQDISEYEEEIYKPYAYASSTQKYLSMSVSEIKRKHQENQIEEQQWAYEQLIKSVQEPIPAFMDAALENQPLQGARYGTLMHLVLAKLDFSISWTRESLEAFVQKMVKDNIITSKEGGRISIHALQRFTSSSLYQRILKADSKQIRQEQPFVLQIDDEGDGRMIQGVIDLYFVEEDALVLVDYKTDFLKNQDASILIERYQLQLEYYKKALERMTGKHVKQTIIYSFSLNEALDIIIDKQ